VGLTTPATPELFQFDGVGVRLTGERWATESGGAVVLLLHGGGQTRHSWKRTAERLAASGRTAIALDARGHGDSEWHPNHDYSLDGFADDLSKYVATLPNPPVLVGASLGGITSLVAAGEHPGLASGLVLVDVVVRVEPEGVARIRDFMSASPEGFASLEEVADAIAAYNPLRPRPRTLDGLRKNVRQHADGRWYWHWDPAFMGIGDEPQRRIDRGRLRTAASNLTIPTLIVRGVQSDIVSDAGLADMLALVPHAQVIDVQSAGHMVAGDDNDVFAGRLQEFLDEIDPAESLTISDAGAP
jgi:pimeloyl-ACP methyl ester carboxylesterase